MTDRAMLTTLTMRGVVGNRTKVLSSGYYTTIVPLDERSFSLSISSNQKGIYTYYMILYAHLKKKILFKS